MVTKLPFPFKTCTAFALSFSGNPAEIFPLVIHGVIVAKAVRAENYSYKADRAEAELLPF